MNNTDLNAFLIGLTKSFYDFSNRIAHGVVPELAPPFLSYHDFDGDIISYYEWFFDKYNECLSALPNDEIERVGEMMSALIEHSSGRVASFSLIQDVQRVQKMIIDAMVQYFKGFPSEAMAVVESEMLKDNMHLFLLLPQLEISGFSLYRIARTNRRVESGKDMFHVPFNKRCCCGTYRYSIPGYPSLYLSHRLDVSKREMDVSGRESYYAACFNPVNPLRFVDLGLTKSFEAIWERYSLLVFYPLIMACGLKVKDSKMPFKPEYVIPQLLTQVIRLHMTGDVDFDGISYISTKLDAPDYFDLNQRNYVLWIKGADQENHYSEQLAEKFRVSGPLRCCGMASTIKIENKLKGMEFKPVL